VGRASLAHLVLWLTGCAIYFSLARQFLPQPPESPRQFLLLSALALYTSLCWTGMAVVVSRVFGIGRPPIAIEPGAWLLFSLGCILTIDLGVAFLPSSLPMRREPLQIGGTCLALVLPTLSRRMPRSWKGLFVTLALLATVQLVALVASRTLEFEFSERRISQLAIIRSSIGLMALAAVVLYDHRAGPRFGWLHWMGVAATIIWLLL
jgi:hypothetical protein